MEISDKSNGAQSIPLIFCVEDSLANHTALQENEQAAETSGTCGQSLHGLFASLNQDGLWLKMSGGYYLAKLDGSLVEFSGIWPASGMMRNGRCFRQRRLVRHISAKGSGLWPTPRNNTGPSMDAHHLSLDGAVRQMWPTPKANDAEKRGKIMNIPRNGLPAAVQYATPQARDYRTGSTKRVDEARKGIRSVNLNDQIGGQLNPTWVEWPMGFPTGWTDLED